MRTCTVCGIETCETFFPVAYRKVGCHGNLQRRSVCKLCAQTQRDDAKRACRPYPKAARTLRHHSEDLLAKGKISAKDELKRLYGWNLSDMAHDIEHSYSNGCKYCREPFKSMGHGLRDITLDIMDPTKPPNYRTNVQWCCATCNSIKQSMSPEEWGEWLLYADRWTARQDELKRGSFAGLPMFDYMSSM